MSSIRINISKNVHEVRFFYEKESGLNGFKLPQHVYKHYLNPQEPWHVLNNATWTRQRRLKTRQRLIRIGCSGDYHHKDKCEQFSLCSDILTDASPKYIEKLKEIINETVESGAVMFVKNPDRIVFLSSEGIFASAKGRRNSHRWNVVTCYFPREKRYKYTDENNIYERVLIGIDYLHKRFQLKRRIVSTLNDDLWKNYFRFLDEGSH